MTTTKAIDKVLNDYTVEIDNIRFILKTKKDVLTPHEKAVLKSRRYELTIRIGNLQEFKNNF